MSVIEINCFDRVDLVSELKDSVMTENCDNFDFDTFLDFLFALSIFSNAFKFSVVKRAGFKGLSALILIGMSGLCFQVW